MGLRQCGTGRKSSDFKSQFNFLYISLFILLSDLNISSASNVYAFGGDFEILVLFEQMRILWQMYFWSEHSDAKNNDYYVLFHYHSCALCRNHHFFA